jgi:hypothetical protein
VKNKGKDCMRREGKGKALLEKGQGKVVGAGKGRVM